ncbi:MAG: hypothetical protein K6G81_10900, partial [Lachnospiraceae bacterium]|nr:hypothetical protein [Lachnospiraceae bacterium]
MAVSKVLSIEITDLTTHICEIGYNKKNPVIFKSIIMDNPAFSVEDGFVLDRQPYKTALKDELTAAKIKTKDVVFVLSSNKVINREVTIPDMKEELIMGLIENERHEYFPMDTTGHVFTYEILERIKETKQMRISIYAAPETLIKNMTTLAGELELSVVAIDYTGNAVYQWLKRDTEKPMEMYLQVNEKNSQFTILDDGMLELQRNMSFGVTTLVNAMNDSRYFDDELKYTDALIRLKEDHLLFGSYEESDSAMPETEEERRLIALKARLTDATRPMIGNLSSVLEYYNTKKRQAIMRESAEGGAESDQKAGKGKFGALGLSFGKGKDKNKDKDKGKDKDKDKKKAKGKKGKEEENTPADANAAAGTLSGAGSNGAAGADGAAGGLNGSNGLTGDAAGGLSGTNEMADGMTTAAGTDSLAGNGGPGADRMAAGFDGAAGDNGATNAAGSAAA